MKSLGVLGVIVASFIPAACVCGEPQATTSSVAASSPVQSANEATSAVLVGSPEISLEEGKSHEFALVYQLNSMRDGNNLDFGCDDLWMECLGIQCDNTKGEMSLKLRADAGRLPVGKHTSVIAVYEKNSDVMLAKTSLVLTVKDAAVKVQDSATTEASTVKKTVEGTKTAATKTSRSAKETPKPTKKSESVKKPGASAKKDSVKKAVPARLPVVSSTPVPPKKRTFFGELLHTPGSN